MTGDIAIVGMAGRFPGAPSVREYWSNIMAGRVTITNFTRDDLIAAGVGEQIADDPAYVPARGVLADPELFDADFFGIAPKEAELMDPQHRLLMQTAWEALESGGLATDAPFGRVGLFAGAGFNYYLLNQVLARPAVLENHGLLSIVLGNEKDHLATKVAYRLGLCGPAVTVQTACSTSLVAVHLACQSLRAGDSDIALAGGVCIALPQQSGYLHESKGILSPDGACRPFDAGAAGMVPGNGVAIVALKRAADARRDGDHIYALVKGSAVNNDGSGRVGYTAPGVAGQIDLLNRAYQNAEVEPATVGYLEAHGTATEAGDAIELAALAEVFGQAAQPCSIGSVKANVGHLDAAAGVTGLIKAALALHHHQIPPLAGLKEPRREFIDGSVPFIVDLIARRWDVAEGAPRRAAVSSFGLGGTNAHVVLQEEPAAAVIAEPAGGGAAVLTVSARSAGALRSAADRLAEHLRDERGLCVHDVALTLQSHRRGFRHRLVVSATDTQEAATRLIRARGREAKRQPSVVFLLPGQGAETPAMASGLYHRYPLFRSEIDRGAELLCDQLRIDLREVLVDEDPGDLIHRTDITQPALVLHEYALGRLLMSWGIRPAALIGHSAGEITAAALANEADIADLLRIVALRGALMQDAPEGGMAVVFAGEDAVRRRLPDGLDIAAVNAPETVVVAGPVPVLAEFCDRLATAGIGYRTMPARRAFHSRMMAEAAVGLGQAAAVLPARGRTCAVISSQTGEFLPENGTRAADYWPSQMLSPVRYQDAVRTALKLPGPVLVEVGPGTALSSAASQVAGADEVPVIALQPSRRVRADDGDVLNGVGTLWTAGAEVNWAAVRARAAAQVVLPTYPFAGSRHWLDVATPAPAATRRPLEGPDANGSGPVEGDVLREIIELWQTLLGTTDVAADANFFRLGGESLLFVQMLARVRRKFGIELPVSELMNTPTPQALAAQVSSICGAAGQVP